MSTRCRFAAAMTLDRRTLQTVGRFVSSSVLLISLASAQTGRPTCEAASSGKCPESASAQSDLHQSEPEKKQKESSRRGTLVVAPLPISSPALGTGIVPVVGYIFKLQKSDMVSLPSAIGGAGLITDNGSRAFAAFADLFMMSNTYRVTGMYAYGNLNYDLYGIGIGAGDAGRKLPLQQKGQVFRGEILRRIKWDLFVGARFWTGGSQVELRSATEPDTQPQPPPDIGLETILRAVGLHAKRETAPNRFYPTSGSLVDFTADFFSQGLGSKYSFQSYRFTFNKYASLSKKQVLAYNLFVCGTGGEPPFYGNCIYGTNNELRGYTAGRYLDRYMFATQLEYRLSLPKRFGIVGFGGVGEVVPGGSQFFRVNNFLPAGGVGARFQLSKTYGVNLRSDFARGKDNWTWSMGVGEAF